MAGEKGNSGRRGIHAAHARVPEVHGRDAWAQLRATLLAHAALDVIAVGIENKCGVVAVPLAATRTRGAVIHAAGRKRRGMERFDRRRSFAANATRIGAADVRCAVVQKPASPCRPDER